MAKFTVDIELKLVHIDAGVTSLDVQIDLYSDLKLWFKTGSNSGSVDFPIRTIGGDPTSGSQKAGDIYFMQNGWRVVYDPTETVVIGALYSDDFVTPWLQVITLKTVFPAVVSSLVTALTVPTSQENADAVSAILNVPSVDEIWQKVVETEGSYTAQQAVSVMLSVLAGVSNNTDSSATFKTPNGATVRVTTTLNDKNERTNQNLSPSS